MCADRRPNLPLEGAPRSFAGFVLLIGLAFVVLLVVYVYVGRLSNTTPQTPSGEAAESASVGTDDLAAANSQDAAPATIETGPGTPEPGASGRRMEPPSPESVSVVAKPGPLPTQPDAEAQIVVYRDQRSRFSMELLDTWRVAVVDGWGEDGRPWDSGSAGRAVRGAVQATLPASASDFGNAAEAGSGAADDASTGAGSGGEDAASASAGTADAAGTDASDYDIVFFRDGTDERLAVMVRYDASHRVLEQWVERLAPGTSPVDGRSRANATIAGQPARIVWRDESPTSPAFYAALLAHGDRAYAITYSAADGGAMIQEFLRALVTFEFAATESLDTIPPIPQPSSRYYPYEALLEGSAARVTATPGGGY